VRQLLHSALGCNIAWGIIDGVMYIMNCLTERSGKARLLEAVQHAPNPAAGLELVRAKVESEFEALSKPEDREALCQAIFKHATHARPIKTRVTKEDFYGALACFWLVFISCLPAAAPFLIFDQPRLALRVSNFLLIAMLFLVGHNWRSRPTPIACSLAWPWWPSAWPSSAWPCCSGDRSPEPCRSSPSFSR